MSQRHFEGLETNSMETFDHQTDHFTVAHHVVEADKLGSDLKNFPAAPGVFSFVAENRRSIGKPQRQHRPRKPHRNRSGDLRRGIRTKKQRAASRTIDELIALLDQFRFKPWSQYIEGNEKKKDEPEKKNGSAG